MTTVVAVLESMRIKQWTKNLLVFMPLFFGRRLFDVASLFNAVVALCVFCLASSGIYLINDVKDRKRDSLHPKKREKPIAAGILDAKLASTAAVVLIISSLLAASVLGQDVFLVILCYIIVNLFYVSMLKRAVILDVMMVAVGFELRVWGGALAAGMYPSAWIQVCVFSLALFLGFNKRKHEKISLYRDVFKRKRVFLLYKFRFLDQMIMMSGALCIAFYSLYAISVSLTKKIGNARMVFTIPFVIYGIFRFFYLINTRKDSGDAGDIVVADLPLFIAVLLWLAVSSWALYAPSGF